MLESKSFNAKASEQERCKARELELKLDLKNEFPRLPDLSINRHSRLDYLQLIKMVECRRKNFYLRIVANNRIVAAEEGKKVEEGKGNILYINFLPM